MSLVDRSAPALGRARHWYRGLITLVALFGSGCGTRTQTRTLVEPKAVATLDHKSPYLKIHLRDGGIYVLSSWRVDSISGLVVGDGQRLNFNRQVLGEGPQQVPMDSVALFETNVTHQSVAVASLAVITGASAALTIYCLADTKACFGSCPTFYLSDGQSSTLQAEGFSQSIAPSLEATDIDALYRARPRGRTLSIEVRNEALETHVIRYARVLVAPRPPEGRVLAAGDGRFFSARSLTAPTSCQAMEGDCRGAIDSFDGVERSSLADSTDLATRETIDLEFPVAFEHPGLIISSRQTLLTTYLLYQTLAYMGTSATQMLSRLGRSTGSLHHGGMLGILGGVDVLVADSAGRWVPVATDNEVGPLATDTRVVPLSSTRTAVTRVRLRLTRGDWRIDYLALAELGPEVRPVTLEPTRVLREGKRDDYARQLLIDSTTVLITLPGDAYTLQYTLPDDPDRLEFFLQSRGYYLEWMRNEWLGEENHERMAMTLLEPARALRVLAPEFKRYEASMEQVFWRSRYAKP